VQAGEVQLGSRLINLMCACEYVGNGVKDLVCAPRPMGHPKGAGKTKLLLSEKGGSDDDNINALVWQPFSAMLITSTLKGSRWNPVPGVQREQCCWNLRDLLKTLLYYIIM
jgi:hypothetical protein